MPDTDSDRESRLRKSAARLLFAVEKRGTRFSLRRDAEVDAPVVHENVTIDEAEKILETWKLRGPHGG
jgi:hypothetical protein